MTLETSSVRRRLTSAALAFAVVSGAAVLGTSPAYASAAPVDTPPSSAEPAGEPEGAAAPVEPTTPGDSTPAPDGATGTETSGDSDAASDADAPAPPASSEQAADETPVPPAAEPAEDAANVAYDPQVVATATQLGISEAALNPFTVTATGFAPNSPITLDIGWGAESTTQTLTTDAAGRASFTPPVAMEAYAVGTASYTFSQPELELRASTSITFVDDTDEFLLGLEPAVHGPGRSMGIYEATHNPFVLSAVGFAPTTPIEVTIDWGFGPQPAATLMTDTTGGATYTPVVTPDSYDGVTAVVYTFTQPSTGITASTTVDFHLDLAEFLQGLGPSATVLDDEIAPNEAVVYRASGFTPGATMHIEVSGPASGSVVDTVDERSQATGEITFNEYDATTGAFLGRLDWPAGTYTLTFTEAGSHRTASVTFTVTGESRSGGTSSGGQTGASTGASHAGGSQTGGSGTSTTGGRDELATTGAGDELFGAAGLGLLLAGAGATALVLRRRRADA